MLLQHVRPHRINQPKMPRRAVRLGRVAAVRRWLWSNAMKTRYAVTYSLLEDVERVIKDWGIDPEIDGTCDAVLEAEQERTFPNIGLARAYAKRVAPKCEGEYVRIYTEHLRVVDCHDGGPLLHDWEAEEDFEEVDASAQCGDGFKAKGGA